MRAGEFHKMMKICTWISPSTKSKRNDWVKPSIDAGFYAWLPTENWNRPLPRKIATWPCTNMTMIKPWRDAKQQQLLLDKNAFNFFPFSSDFGGKKFEKWANQQPPWTIELPISYDYELAYGEGPDLQLTKFGEEDFFARQKSQLAQSISTLAFCHANPSLSLKVLILLAHSFVPAMKYDLDWLMHFREKQNFCQAKMPLHGCSIMYVRICTQSGFRI